MRAVLLALALFLVGCSSRSEADVIRHIIWKGFPGQSNCWGTNPGGSGSQTLAAVPYYDALIGTTPALTQTLHDLDDTHGYDFELGKTLYNAGYHPIIVNVCRGSTYANDWIPGGTYYNAGIAEMQRAWSQILAAYPNDTFVHHHVADQGEEDIRYPTAGIPSLWASNFTQAHNGLISNLVGVTSMSIWINQTNPNVTGATFPDLVNGLQLQSAGSASHYLVRSGYAYEVGNLHMTTAGYISNGRGLAAMIIAGTPMGTLYPTARSKLVDHQTNVAAYSPAATHYVHWYAGGVALTNGNSPGYAANAVTNNTTTWPNAAARVKANGVAFVQTPSGTGLSPDEVRITDNATEGQGTTLGGDTFTAVAWTVAGGPVSIAIGAFTITAPTNVAVGGFTDTVVHSLYNLMFGGTAYAALATTYLSYWAGDPAGAGAIAGGSVALTQASQWGAAASGQAQSILAITLAQQVTGTFFALHSAAAGAGNLLMSCTRTASIGASGTILAGQLLTTML